MQQIEEVLKTKKFRDEQHKAVLNMLYTSYWLRNQVATALKPYGITAEQFNVLRILRGALPQYLCVKDIAERMIEPNSNVPRILERLQRKGLIERMMSEFDRRESVTIITPLALETLTKADTALKNKENEIMQITNEEATLLNQILDKLRS